MTDNTYAIQYRRRNDNKLTIELVKASDAELALGIFDIRKRTLVIPEDIHLVERGAKDHDISCSCKGCCS